MQKQTTIFAALGIALVATLGCRVNGPDFSNRETVQQQRDRASGQGGQLPFDPFPSTDVGPGEEDFRPRDFANPRAPIEQSRAYMGQGK